MLATLQKVCTLLCLLPAHSAVVSAPSGEHCCATHIERDRNYTVNFTVRGMQYTVGHANEINAGVPAGVLNNAEHLHTALMSVPSVLSCQMPITLKPRMLV
jgi:hypothetical protein